MAHMSGSMGHYSGYGTIQIHLQDTVPWFKELNIDTKFKVNHKKNNCDRIEGRMVLVDSNYTIGENPPPFSVVDH